MRHLGLALSTLALACSAPAKLPITTLPPAVSASGTAVMAPPIDPCEVAAKRRSEAEALAAAGRLARALELIRRADNACATEAPRSYALKLSTLIALDRIEEARMLGVIVEADSGASAEAKALVEKARAATADSAPGEELLSAAQKALREGRGADAQRLFDRAAVHLEKKLGAPVTLQVRNGYEADAGLPWKSNGGIFPHGLSVIDPTPAISHDGKSVVVGDGRTVIVADLATGQLRLRLEGHEANVTSVSFSADDSLVASGSYDDTAKVWRVATGQLVMTAPVGAPSREVRILQGGKVLACAHYEASLWDIPSGKPIAQRKAPQASLIAIDPYGVATVAQDWTPVGRMDLMTGATLPGKPPTHALTTADAKRQLLVFDDHAEVYRQPGQSRLHSIRFKKSFISQVILSKDGKRAAVGKTKEEYGSTESVDVLDLDHGKVTASFAITEAILVGFRATGEIVIHRHEKQVMIDPKSGAELRALAPKERIGGIPPLVGMEPDALTPDSFAMREDGLLAFAGAWENGGPEGSDEWPLRMMFLDSATGALREIADPMIAHHLSFVDGGKKLLGWAYNGVGVWDVATGKRLRAFDAYGASRGVEFVSPDGRFAVVSEHEVNHLYDLEKGAIAAGFDAPLSDRVLSFSRSSDAMFVVDDKLRLARVDLPSGKRALLGVAAEKGWHHGSVTEDGGFLAIAHYDPARKEHLLSVDLNKAPSAPVDLTGPVDDMQLLGLFGAHGLVVDPQSAGPTAPTILDLASGEKKPLTTELWESMNAVALRDVVAIASRPEKIVGLFSATSGKPIGAVRALASKQAAYVLLPDGHVQIFGPSNEVLAHAFCQAGPFVFPVEVCQDRFVIGDALGDLR